MAEETITFPEPPALPDNADGVLYMLGTEFVITTDGLIKGVELYAPTTDNTINHYIALFEKTGSSTGTLLASKQFAQSNGVKQKVYFDSAWSAVTTKTYVVAVLVSHYVATTSFNWAGASTAHITPSSTNNGRLEITTADNIIFPVNVSGNSATYHVSPIFELAASPSSVTLTPVSLTLTPQALTPVPQPVSVNLTTVSLSLTPQALTPVPGPVSVTLSPVPITLSPLPLAPTPGSVSISLTPAALSLTPQALSPAAVAPSVTLSQVPLVLTPQPLTAVPGLVTISLTPVQIHLIPVALITASSISRPYDVRISMTRRKIEILF